MKILHANNKIPKSQYYFLDELFSLVDRTDTEFLQYYKTVEKNIDKIGMKYPIVITSEKYYWGSKKWKDKDKLGVVVGTNRLRYAIKNNYTMIEGVFIKKKDHANNYIKKTFERVV